jgi:isopenicillin-N epimerase
MNHFKNLFLLDPGVIFLNHGSFGACPKPVFAAYQAWQHQLEEQPVLFLGREFADLQLTARQKLGVFLGAQADDLVYIPNATYGVNLIAHSLAIQPGDEILTTDHEYGACDNTWEFICRKTGGKYIHQPLDLPINSVETFADQFWQAVTGRTKLIFLSQITSPTAQRLPVETICQRARQAGILTFIDGAHAPGQIPLDLEASGADFYTGNAHKWMLSPKGAAFLYVRRESQPLVEPLVVSWGYSANKETTTGSHFIDLLQWTGTHDPSAALSVPIAIEFMQEHHWDQVRRDCHGLLLQALSRIQDLTGLPSVYPADDQPFTLPPQLAVVSLPQSADIVSLKARLYDHFRVEVPLIEWNGRKFMRLSIQAYNSQEDIDVLLEGLEVLLRS